MFIAIHTGGYDNTDFVGKGQTLKAAFQKVKEEIESADGEFDQDSIEFFEATKVDVEFQIVKKEVVTKVTAVKSK